MIFAVDIGSTLAGRRGVAFAWCGVKDESGPVVSGTSPVDLVSCIEREILAGNHVSLGLEAPLFIPVPDDASNLSRGRENEGNRSWAAPAGGYVASLALHQAAWILGQLHRTCFRSCTVATDPLAWETRDKAQMPVLFCWEAFVSGPAHGSHAGDAATAAMYFHSNQSSLATAVTAENPISMFGAALLWSGWSRNLECLHQPLVVLRPKVPWSTVK